MKRHCQKYKKWIDSGKGKGNVMIFKGEVLVFETNNVEYARDSWWIDSGVAIHVTNSFQGLVRKRVPRKDEVSLVEPFTRNNQPNSTALKPIR